MRPISLILGLILTSWFALGDAMALTSCQKLYTRYQLAPGHKAFATTLGNDPGHHPTSCSFVPGFTMKRLAEKRAVVQCNQHRRVEDGGPCKIIDSQ